ncbi:LuxR C-terminal-related transcriptional regulator [Streptomyces antimycoticus]|uniref:helix-turn-helix transcriptional regulator n=1 Tax=Streptomyces antimycoticus TaxID=68175 RepID=UPI00342062E1
MTDRITVQVCADDPISEAGVISLLRPRPEIRLDDGADDPAVTVVAADISDPAGYQLLRTAQHSGSSRLVLLVSRLLDHQLSLAAECGAAGIMWRASVDSDRLVRMIQTVATGDGHLPPDLQTRLLHLLGQLHGREQSLGAEREIDVLRLVAEGYDTPEIALKLSFSERTIKNVLHAFITRHHLRNRSHAVAFALRKGLI